MDQPHYTFRSIGHEYLFSFVSEGKWGSIEKRVQFTPISDSVFNLGFGDWNDKCEEIDDTAVSDNGDMEQVLATVIVITFHFLEEHDHIAIFLTGSTPSRTRLYQIIINKYFNLICTKVIIYGYKNNHWESFRKNVNYEFFMVSKLF